MTQKDDDMSQKLRDWLAKTEPSSIYEMPAELKAWLGKEVESAGTKRKTAAVKKGVTRATIGIVVLYFLFVAVAVAFWAWRTMVCAHG